jgi:hypothetical protein
MLTTKLDLSNAYFHIPISLASRKFLRFVWNNRVYQFLTVPFGLAVAPHVFECPLLLFSVIEIELPLTEDGTSPCLRSETQESDCPTKEDVPETQDPIPLELLTKPIHL